MIWVENVLSGVNVRNRLVRVHRFPGLPGGGRGDHVAPRDVQRPRAVPHGPRRVQLPVSHAFAAGAGDHFADLAVRGRDGDTPLRTGVGADRRPARSRAEPRSGPARRTRAAGGAAGGKTSASTAQTATSVRTGRKSTSWLESLDVSNSETSKLRVRPAPASRAQTPLTATRPTPAQLEAERRDGGVVVDQAAVGTDDDVANPGRSGTELGFRTARSNPRSNPARSARCQG